MGHFVDFDKASGCGVAADGKRHYCIPRIFRPLPSWLFHNNGDGTFTDVSKESGIASHLGKTLGSRLPPTSTTMATWIFFCRTTRLPTFSS